MYDAKERDRLRADEKRAALAAYKVIQCCVDCGYNDDARALEFDHIPGSEKIQSVASMMYKSWDKIWDEVAKCEVVCANCHAIRTMDRLGL